MSNEVELPVRQAAVIYLKNMVSGNHFILLYISHYLSYLNISDSNHLIIDAIFTNHNTTITANITITIKYCSPQSTFS